MKKIKTSSIFTIILGVLLTIELVFCQWAISDVLQGNKINLFMEWRMVQVFLGTMIIFSISTFITFFTMYQYMKNK